MHFSRRFVFLGRTANGCAREMQLFLLGYIIISICEIFTVGEFPLPDNVRLVRSRKRGPTIDARNNATDVVRAV